MSLQLRAQLQYEDFRLAVDTALPTQGVTALFGRSGCGKTSLLRIIAGLERLPDTEIHFRDQQWQQGRRFLPTSQRRIGLVFQEHSLLPHLSVDGNLLYGYRRTESSLRRLHPGQVCELLELEPLRQRRIDQLSGGQRQRVSLGRALLTSPQLLLLDEPLAALDSQSRREIMPFLSRLTSESGIPAILVTHAPDEVQYLADHVAFMDNGHIQAVTPLQEALAQPDSPLFHDEGPASVLEGSLASEPVHGLLAFGPEQARLWLQHPDATALTGQQGRLKILARDVSLALDDPQRISIQNHLKVRIESMDPLPDQRMIVRSRLADGQQLQAEITAWSAEKLQLQIGQEVYALIKSVALVR